MWHRATKTWRDEGRLTVVGLVQEQHPDRTRLFAQWQGFDWPILWDPLNITGAAAVPNLTLIDEHGVVRSRRPSLKTIEAEFLDVAFEPPADAAAPPATSDDGLLQLTGLPKSAADRPYWTALSDLLWGGDAALDGANETLTSFAAAHAEDAQAQFRLGVARRMRHDSGRARRGDFAQAVAGWQAALALNPRQYIWRRRIQQYGPALDKPYPFYPWIDEAREALRDRGVEPAPLRAGLSTSERLARGAPSSVAAERPQGVPDAAAVEDDAADRFEVETVFVPDSEGRPRTRLYIGVHARSVDVRVDDAAVVCAVQLEGWSVPVSVSGASEGAFGTRWFEMDLDRPPAGSEPVERSGAVLTCLRGAAGEAVWVRTRFSVMLD